MVRVRCVDGGGHVGGHLGLAVLLDGLRLGETHDREGRVAEDRGGNLVRVGVGVGVGVRIGVGVGFRVRVGAGLRRARRRVWRAAACLAVGPPRAPAVVNEAMVGAAIAGTALVSATMASN